MIFSKAPLFFAVTAVSLGAIFGFPPLAIAAQRNSIQISLCKDIKAVKQNKRIESAHWLTKIKAI